MSSQPTAASSGGTPQLPPATTAMATPPVTYEQRCVVLVDWWLERVEGQEGMIRVAGIPSAPQMRKGVSSSGNIKAAGRVFRSAPIVKRRDYTVLETQDGYLIKIGRALNTPRTRANRFSEEVCESFTYGFPIQWLKLVNPNMEQQNVQAQSESSANAPRHSVEYYMEKFKSDSFTTFMKYAFTEKDFFSYTSNTDGPHDTAGNLPKVVTDPQVVAHGAKRSLEVGDHTADNLPKVVTDPEEVAHGSKRSLEVGDHTADNLTNVVIDPEEVAHGAKRSLEVGDHTADNLPKVVIDPEEVAHSAKRSLEVGDHEEDDEVQITHKEEAVSKTPRKCRVKKLKAAISSEFLRRSTRINKKA